MQALMHLIDTDDNARRAVALCAAKQLTLQHRTHSDITLDEALIAAGGFSINFGGYGSYSRLGLGPTFRNRWRIAPLEEARQQSFAQLTVCFVGHEWSRPLTEQVATVQRYGGTVTTNLEQADIVVKGHDAPVIDAPVAAICVNEATFLRALPAERAVRVTSTARTKALTGEAAALWKLLSARDEHSIQQGLSLAYGLDDAIEALLAGIEIHPDRGDLVRNKRFSGSGAAQPFLDAALYGLLSCVSEGTPLAELRSNIRRIDITLPFLIELAGFDGLTSLSLKLEDEFKSPDLYAFGVFPALRVLSIRPTKKDNYWGMLPELSSLEGLNAPMLEEIYVVRTNLQDCSALALSSQLRKVDFSENAELDNIRGLSSSAASLHEVILNNVRALTELTPLQGTHQLKRLVLRNTAVSSLASLSESYALTELVLEHCAMLTQLNVGHLCLSAPEAESTFSLSGCQALTSLEGMPVLDASYSIVDVDDVRSLTSLAGIERAPHIKELHASYTAITDVSPLRALSQLRTVTLNGCEELQDVSALGSLPFLQEVDLSACTKLTVLPAQWSESVTTLNLSQCAALPALGRLPENLNCLARYSWRDDALDLEGLSALTSLTPIARTKLGAVVKQIDLSGCTQLTTLAGLEGMEYLERIILPLTICDASALKACRHLTSVTVDAAEAEILPTNIAQALISAPRCQITVIGDALRDASVLARLTTLERVDMSSCAELRDVNWVMYLSELREIKLHPDSPAAEAVGAKLDTMARVRKLQQQLSHVLGCDLPTHLVAAKAPKAVVKKNQAISLIFKEIKPLLIANDIAKVQAGLTHLFTAGDASLFEELLEGCDPERVFSSNSQALGKVFKTIKANQRPLARWALLHILAQAPTDSTQLIALRGMFRDVQINFGELPAGATMPSLSRFDGLTSVALDEFPEETLACLTGLSALTNLRIRTALSLKTLQGIEAATQLKSFDVDNCPQLTDVCALSNKASLKTQGFLDLSSVSVLKDIDFLKMVSVPELLRLRVDAHTDLSALRDISAISTLSLHCVGELPDLSALVHITELDFYQIQCSAEEPVISEPVLMWNYHLPKLESLSMNGGTHDFSALIAPALRLFRAWGRTWDESSISRLISLRGLSQIQEFSFYTTKINSLDGLQGSTLAELNLSSLVGELTDISALHAMPNLRHLRLPSAAGVMSEEALSALVHLAGIEHLEWNAYSGSLAFLANWSALRILNLQDSGHLTDMECLIKLPALETIFLRGSEVKRSAWPHELHSKLEYVRSGY